MQIVIDISEKTYRKIKEGFYDENVRKMAIAIGNGKVLPKGHGDLIDRDKIEYLKAIYNAIYGNAIYGHISWSDAIKKIKYSSPIIIEADKGNEE